MNTFTANGFTAQVITDDDAFSKYDVPGCVPAAMLDKKPGDLSPVIFITTGFAELSSPTRNAILTHEIGHIACGHLDQFGGSEELIDNADIEAQADAWAACIVGGEAIDLALEETLTRTIAIIGEWSPIPAEVVDELKEDMLNRRNLRQKYM